MKKQSKKKLRKGYTDAYIPTRKELIKCFEIGVNAHEKKLSPFVAVTI